MAEKAKCSNGDDRDVFSKGLCSGCYGKQWREQRKAERAASAQPPKQLTSGVAESEPVIEGEIVHDTPTGPLETNLVALNPTEMEAARGNMKAWLEQRLTLIEREIVEANRALNEARRNGWSTTALTMARNRAVDDETYYNKILAAVEAGHTIVPEFPIEVFAVRRHEDDPRRSQTFQGAVSARDTFIGAPVEPDCAPVGAGGYRNPQRQVYDRTWENKAPGVQERKEPRYYTEARSTGFPAGPIFFPSMTARSPIMRATSEAMKDKVFDQIGVCHPVIADTATAARRVEARAGRVGDPLVIGQVLRKRVGGKQKCVSFIIAWHLDLNQL